MTSFRFGRPLGVLVAFVLSCGGASKAPDSPPVASSPAPAQGGTGVRPDGGGPDAREPASRGDDPRLVAMLARVAKVRGLAPKRPIPGVVLSRDALLGRVRAHVGEEVPREAIRNEGLSLQLLGLLPPSFDYEATTFQLFEGQLAGFYEPANGTMYLAGDLSDELSEATLAHELVHGLQDHAWGLRERSKYRPGESDRSQAFHALAEGDATSAMADVLLQKLAPGRSSLDLPEGALTSGMLEAVTQAEGPSVPHVMQTGLIAPYLEGTRFVQSLRRAGGWAAVDEAWARPPETTEQLLHVEKWRRREKALAVAAPSLGGLGEGWSTADEDTQGELGLRLLFAEWVGMDDASQLVANWGGDRAVLAHRENDWVVALRLRFDAESRAGKTSRSLALFQALAQAWKQRWGKEVVSERAFVCVARKDGGPLALARQGDDLLVSGGPARLVNGSLAQGLDDCKGVRRWLLSQGASTR